MQMAETQAKVEEAQARAVKAKADAEKAEADAEKAKYEAAKARADLANAHMDNLRTIEAHDHEMARGEVNHRRQHAHEMDRHSVDMAERGINAYRAGEKHDLTMEQMAQPQEEPATVQ
jgi:hypothetical protein